ncbi:MAG TPA: methyltransferase [Thermoanaerobaculia bacterium]|nr:methyltransferase [Thermoanaerobaculia bacterium]
MTGASPEPGSYRDRESRVFYSGGEVFRALSGEAWRQWTALRDRSFFRAATADGKVVATREADPTPPLPPDILPTPVEGILHHERVPFVSYPYEWSFRMLRAAALLQLDLLDAALAEGFVLKDSSAYNVQWRGARPLFVDVGSFEVLAPGDPWVGYLQFCRLFLYPLLLNAYRGVSFQPLLRGSLDGIDPETASRLLHGRDRIRRGVPTHVHLHARLQSAHAADRRSARSSVRDAGFSAKLIVANVRSLRRLVESLRWRVEASTWSGYGTGHGYEEAERHAKEAFVARAAGLSRGRLLWDLGCNDGHFTRIAAGSFSHAVAIDADHLTIDRLFEALEREDRRDVLPLVVNLVDPSPALGWRGRERRTLLERGRPDLVLALALVHHLAIGANVPVVELVSWLADLGGDLVVEFVQPSDPMVERLLLEKRDSYPDYELENFRRRLEERFDIASEEELAGGRRVLFHARRRC